MAEEIIDNSKMSDQEIKNPLNSKVIPEFLYRIAMNPDKAYISGFAKEFDYGKSAVSKYFKALNKLGFVSEEKDGSKVYYRIKERNVKEFVKKMAEESHLILTKDEKEKHMDLKTQEKALDLLERNERLRKYLFSAFLTIIGKFILSREDDSIKKPTVSFLSDDKIPSLSNAFDLTLSKTRKEFLDQIKNKLNEIKSERNKRITSKTDEGYITEWKDERDFIDKKTDIPFSIGEMYEFYDSYVKEEGFNLSLLTSKVLGFGNIPYKYLPIKPSSVYPFRDMKDIEIKDVSDCENIYRSYVFFSSEKSKFYSQLGFEFQVVMDYFFGNATIKDNYLDTVWAYTVQRSKEINGSVVLENAWDFLVEDYAKLGYWENKKDLEESFDMLQEVGLLDKTYNTKNGYRAVQQEEGFQIKVPKGSKVPEEVEGFIQEEKAVEFLQENTEITGITYFTSELAETIIRTIFERNLIIEYLRDPEKVYTKRGVRKDQSLKQNITNLLMDKQGLFVCPKHLSTIFEYPESEIKNVLTDLESENILVSKKFACLLSDKKHKHYRIHQHDRVEFDVLNKDLEIHEEKEFNQEAVDKFHLTSRNLKKIKYKCPKCGNSWDSLELMNEVVKKPYPKFEWFNKDSVLEKIIRNVKQPKDFTRPTRCPICFGSGEMEEARLDISFEGEIDTKRFEKLKKVRYDYLKSVKEDKNEENEQSD